MKNICTVLQLANEEKPNCFLATFTCPSLQPANSENLIRAEMVHCIRPKASLLHHSMPAMAKQRLLGTLQHYKPKQDCIMHGS